jgi:hypothetical protein
MLLRLGLRVKRALGLLLLQTELLQLLLLSVYP